MAKNSVSCKCSIPGDLRVGVGASGNGRSACGQGHSEGQLVSGFNFNWIKLSKNGLSSLSDVIFNWIMDWICRGKSSGRTEHSIDLLQIISWNSPLKTWLQRWDCFPLSFRQYFNVNEIFCLFFLFCLFFAGGWGRCSADSPPCPANR